jgi:hypothetical protein
MISQSIFSERRRQSREGVLGRLENVTYSVLRRYGIAGNQNTVISGILQHARVSSNPIGFERTSLVFSHLAGRPRQGSEGRA